MFLMLSKKPRKSNRSRSNRYRAGLKAKNKRRLGRVYQSHRSLAAARYNAGGFHRESRSVYPSR